MSWELRKALAGATFKWRTCMAYGCEVERWWRILGPLKSDRMTAGRYRVVLCDTCVAALTTCWQQHTQGRHT